MMRLAAIALFVVFMANLVSAANLFFPVNSNRKQQQSSIRSGPPTTFVSVKTGGPIRSDPAMDPSDPLFFVGSSDGNLYAINAMDFSKNFTYKSGAPVFGSPAVNTAASTVVYGDQVGNLLSVAYKAGASDGTLRWRYNTSFPITGRPALSQKSQLAIFGCYDGNIYGVSQSTGKQVWNKTTASFVSASAVLATTSAGVEAVVVGSQDGTLYGLEAATGKELWKFFDGKDGKADPIADACAITTSGAAICTARRGRLFAVNVSTGKKIYERSDRFYGTPNSRPVLSPDQSVVFVVADFNKIFAVDAATGNTKWSYTHPTAYLNTAPVFVAPRAGDDLLVFGTNDDNTTLVALNPTTGKHAWTAQPTGEYNGGAVTTVPIMSSFRDKVIFGTAGGLIIGAQLQ